MQFLKIYEKNFYWIMKSCVCVCVCVAETLPPEQNGLLKEQRFMDSASNSMTPRPQTLRSTSEYQSPPSSPYYHGNGPPLRRQASNPLTQTHRRVEGESHADVTEIISEITFRIWISLLFTFSVFILISIKVLVILLCFCNFLMSVVLFIFSV